MNTGGGGGGGGTHISNDCLDGFLEHLAVAEQTKREGGVVQKLVRLAQVLLADELRPLEWLSAISAPHQVDRPLGAAPQRAHRHWQQNILTSHWGKTAPGGQLERGLDVVHSSRHDTQELRPAQVERKGVVEGQSCYLE